METRAPHIRAVLPLLVFALLCVGLMILMFNRFGGDVPLKARGYTVDVPLSSAVNLVPGSEIQVAGVAVGKVISIEQESGEAVVTMELDSQVAPLREDARAIPRTKTLLGEGYLELALGPRDSAPIPEGGRLDAAQVRPAVELDQFISTFDEQAREDFRRMFAGLSGALEGRAGDLNDALGQAAPFFTDLDDVLATVSRDEQSLERVIASSGDVMSAVGRREGLLRAAITSSNSLLDATARERDGLQRTVTALAPLLRQLEVTSNEVAAASPDLNAAAEALLPSAPLVEPVLGQVESAGPVFEELFEEMPPTLRAGRKALPRVRPIVRGAKRGFRHFYPTSRELIPFIQLAARSRTTVNLAANLGSVINGTIVGPGGLVHPMGAAIASVWNETVSGWKHKLPSNRQNPYPRPPFGLLDSGKLGVLKAYDCRHTDNPLFIPETGGNGSPPCILQGPWEFNGQSGYYPRLKKAKP